MDHCHMRTSAEVGGMVRVVRVAMVVAGAMMMGRSMMGVGPCSCRCSAMMSLVGFVLKMHGFANVAFE